MSELDDPPLLTPIELIERARNRGRTLELTRTGTGRLMITDGIRRYILPILPEGVMPASLVEDVLYLFFGTYEADRLRLDFHLDPEMED